jgi:hypothetical protein
VSGLDRSGEQANQQFNRFPYYLEPGSGNNPWGGRIGYRTFVPGNELEYIGKPLFPYFPVTGVTQFFYEIFYKAGGIVVVDHGVWIIDELIPVPAMIYYPVGKLGPFTASRPFQFGIETADGQENIIFE